MSDQPPSAQPPSGSGWASSAEPAGAGYAGPPTGPPKPSGPRADFWSRLAAALLDGILLAVVNAVLNAILGAGAAGGLGFLVSFAYFGFLEGGPAGQTLGKKVLNIRVVRMADGGPLGWGTALLRHLCRYLSALPCGLGYFWMLWDDEKMTWHDKLSETVVVPASAWPAPPDSFGKPPS